MTTEGYNIDTRNDQDYSPTLKALHWVQDANSHVKQYVSDAFGRLTKVEEPQLLWGDGFDALDSSKWSFNNNARQSIVAEGGNSLASIELVRQFGASAQDIAGMLTLSVPVIAYALAKGGEMAATSMISSLTQPAAATLAAMPGRVMR